MCINSRYIRESQCSNIKYQRRRIPQIYQDLLQMLIFWKLFKYIRKSKKIVFFHSFDSGVSSFKFINYHQNWRSYILLFENDSYYYEILKIKDHIIVVYRFHAKMHAMAEENQTLKEHWFSSINAFNSFIFCNQSKFCIT